MEALIKQASNVYKENFKQECVFERALFLSWYCSKGDCKFCYMSTQKALIKNPKKARRNMASILAETIISKACGWQIEFISGGYESFSIEELQTIVKNVKLITGKKQWLNIGTLAQNKLSGFLPDIQGYIGTLECVNPTLRERICPSKPLDEIEKTFVACDKLGLKKGVTVIIGLGETLDDFDFLKQYIKKYNIARITFYSLNPQKGTIFTKSPNINYYEKWIAKTRIEFPKIHIVAGAWHDKIDYYSRLLLAGANNITKFPVLKFFGTKEAKAVENQIKLAGRKFNSTFTKMPVLDLNGLDSDVAEKVKQYFKKMHVCA